MVIPAKRIALVALPPDYFWSFAQALEGRGFEVYWICLRRSHAKELRRSFGVPSHRVLDVLEGIEVALDDVEDCRTALATLESAAGPRINDVILMDRVLRRRPSSEVIRLLHHVQSTVAGFLANNAIELIDSGRDTAPQIVIMMTARRLGIPWIVPTRLRIPREVYGFCPGHETTGMIRFRPLVPADRAWAERVLEDFRNNRGKRPALKTAARNFQDVVRLLPVHIRTFGGELVKSVTDGGNRYTRYTIPELIRLYARRRWNLFRYKAFPPHVPQGEGPFCLYALHTQPESSIDVAGSYFSDQIALITFISRSMPATHELYVKVHPTDVDGRPLAFYRQIARIPGVRLIDHALDSRHLAQRASIVFALTGTIGYEAALMGKPVVTFAKNHFNDLPTVYYCDAPPRLPALIESLLASPPQAADTTAGIVQFLADMRTRCFDGEFNRMYGENPTALSAQDLQTLQVAFDDLYRILVADNRRVSELTR